MQNLPHAVPRTAVPCPAPPQWLRRSHGRSPWVVQFGRGVKLNSRSRHTSVRVIARPGRAAIRTRSGLTVNLLVCSRGNSWRRRMIGVSQVKTIISETGITTVQNFALLRHDLDWTRVGG